MGAWGPMDSNPILLEFTREVEEEERLTRNLSNQGLILDISAGSVRIRLAITGDSLMTKDNVLVKIVKKNLNKDKSFSAWAGDRNVRTNTVTNRVNRKFELELT